MKKSIGIFRFKFLLSFLLVLLACTSVYAVEFDYDLIKDDALQNVNVRGVNASGLTVGWSENGGFIYDKASGFSSLTADVLSATVNLIPMDINDTGQIVGYFTDSTVDPAVERGFLCNSDGTGLQVITYSSGAQSYRTIVNGLSNDGTMVGIYLEAGSDPGLFGNITAHGFHTTDGIAFTDLDYTGSGITSVQTYPWDINDAGRIVGYFSDNTGKWRGFLSWPLGFYAPIEFEHEDVTYETFPTSINSTNEVAGYFNPGGYGDQFFSVLGYSCESATTVDETNECVEDRYISGFFMPEPATYQPIQVVHSTRIFCLTDAPGLVVAGDMVEQYTSDQTIRSGYVLTVTETITAPPAQVAESQLVPQAYAVTEITLPDPYPVGGHATIPMAINNYGKAVVTVMPFEDGKTESYMWQGSGATADKIAPASEVYNVSVASDINDYDIVAGYYGESPADEGMAFTWTSGTGVVTETEICTLNFPGKLENLIILNNNNRMAMRYYLGGFHGTVWTRGAFSSTARTFYPESHTGVIADLNDFGQGISGSLSDGLVWDKRNWTTGIIPGASPEGYGPAAINNSGLIVGTKICAESIETITCSNAFVCEPGELNYPTDLPGFADGPYMATHTYSTASDVNDDGDIVGIILDPTDFTTMRIALWSRSIDSGSGNSVYLAPKDVGSLTINDGELTVTAVAATVEGLQLSGYTFLKYVVAGIGPQINSHGQIAAGAYKSDGTPVAVLLSPATPICEELTNGQLDLDGGTVCVGETIDVPVIINTAPYDVDALGFEITYDPAILEYQGWLDSPLLTGFDYKGANLVEPGVVRVGAFTMKNQIISGTQSIMASIQFLAISAGETKVDLANLDDDMDGWTTTHACVTAAGKDLSADGDVNGDGAATPGDALCIFEKAMNETETQCGPASEIACDVDQNCICEPDDVLCVLNFYLALPSCLD